MREDNRQDANTVRASKDKSANAVCINHVAASSPQQVKQIVRCNKRGRYTQQMSQAVTPIKLEIKTHHNVDLSDLENTVQVAKEPVAAPNKRVMVNTTNCPDTGTTIFLSVPQWCLKTWGVYWNIGHSQLHTSTA